MLHWLGHDLLPETSKPNVRWHAQMRHDCYEEWHKPPPSEASPDARHASAWHNYHQLFW